MPEVDPEAPLPSPWPAPLPWPRPWPWPDPLPWPDPRPWPDPWPPRPWPPFEPFRPGRQITLPLHGLTLPPPVLPIDGGSVAGPPPGYREMAGTATYSALRLGDTVLVRAQGQLSSGAQIADLRIDSRLIHPFQLRFVVYTPDFGGITVVRNFDFVERFGFPANAPVIVIHDAKGAHEVAIAEIGTGGSPALLAGNSAERATGLGGSLQEAFDNAVKALPASTDVADDLLTYRIVESGFLRGGFPGFSQHYAIVELSSSAGAAQPSGTQT